MPSPSSGSGGASGSGSGSGSAAAGAFFGAMLVALRDRERRGTAETSFGCGGNKLEFIAGRARPDEPEVVGGVQEEGW